MATTLPLSTRPMKVDHESFNSTESIDTHLGNYGVVHMVHVDGHVDGSRNLWSGVYLDIGS